jgi:hypothetical protein
MPSRPVAFFEFESIIHINKIINKTDK